MMSSSIRPKDFFEVTQFAYRVYKMCKEAPRSFGDLAQQVLSLRAILEECDDTFSGQGLSKKHPAYLTPLGQGCSEVLKDLEDLVLGFQTLGSQAKREWERNTSTLDQIVDLRARLSASTLLLSTFINTSELVVQKKLERYLSEFRAGKHPDSPIPSLAFRMRDEPEVWHDIQRELEDNGITWTAFEANVDIIMEWFGKALATQAFDEPNIRSFDQMSTGSHTPNTSTTMSTSPERKRTLSASFSTSTFRSLDLESAVSSSSTSPSKVSFGFNCLASGTPMSTPDKNKRRRTNSGLIPRLISTMERVHPFGCDLCKTVEAENAAETKRLLRQGTRANCIHEGPSSLDTAVSLGNETIVRYLLEAGADPLALKKGGSSPLQYTVGTGNEAVARLLLEAGADINVTDREGSTVLHRAAFIGHDELVQMFLKFGADQLAKNSYGRTALYEAIRNNQVTTACMLLDSGSDMSVKDDRGWTVLHEAAYQGNESLVSLAMRRCNTWDRTKSGDTALSLAAQTYPLGRTPRPPKNEAVVRLLEERTFME